jgi:hypothetical protein
VIRELLIFPTKTMQLEDSNTSTPLPQPYEISMARWAMWLSALLVFVVVMSGTVRYTEGDARYSLLATTALIEQGNLRMDAYVQELDLEALNNGHNWMIFRSGDAGHFYYDYPVGTTIFSIPFVWIGRQLGMNPAVIADDTSMQIGIAAVLCVAIFLLLFRLSNLYLGEWAALLFSLGIFFGTTFTSTLGTALWSQNFQTLFTMLVILELAEWEQGKRTKIRGAWMGFLLFAAYLCRPTSAALILPVMGYLAWRDRKSLKFTVAVSGGLFLLFLLWSWLEFHMILPRYYDPRLWRPGKGFIEHLMPLLFGPARGLWSFTPVLLLLFGAWALKKVRFQPLHLLVWVWLILHTILLLRSQSPWAGWSFGPRFFTEMIPGFAVVLLMMAKQLPEMPLKLRTGLAASFVFLSGIGVYIHVFQGLNNIETQAWNDNPNIDQNWKTRRWDWRHPQFLASGYQREKLAQETALELRIRQFVGRLPNGVSMLYGPPDPNVRQCFVRWNRQDYFGKQQTLFNSLYALQSSGEKEFWFSSSQLAEVREIPGIAIDSLSFVRLCLGDFLKANSQHEIFLAGKDDATTSPALETRAYLKLISSEFDSVKLRESYIAHIKGGRLIHEQWGPEKQEYIAQGLKKVRVQSAGLFVGNFASILLDGRECSLNNRGINVLVLDKSREVVWTTSFDTHADDRERLVLMKAMLPKNSSN